MHLREPCNKCYESYACILTYFDLWYVERKCSNEPIITETYNTITKSILMQRVETTNYSSAYYMGRVITLCTMHLCVYKCFVFCLLKYNYASNCVYYTEIDNIGT